jgi:FkbM family methyltransferase
MLKSLASAAAPPALLRWAKRGHYLRVVRDFEPGEERDLEIVRHLVRPRDRVVDVGANIGVYTRFLSEWVGPQGRVFSIEPIPESYSYLTHSVERLGLRNVECWNWAASDASGVATMQIPQMQGGRNYYQARIVDASAPGAGIRVSLRTLDAALADLHPIAFVKCDVEGHELACVRGAQDLLRRDRPAWLVEVSGDPDRAVDRAQELFALFASHGYAPHWYDGAALRARQRGDTSINYFFLQPAHLERLSRQGVQSA